MKNTENNQIEDIPDFIEIKEDNIKVNSINLYDVMNWVLEQNQETKLQLLDFVFSQSGLTSNKEAAKINNRSEAAETQYGKKHKLGHFKYSII